MPRPTRWRVPGGIFHVTVRGNNRQQIFLDEADHQRYLTELSDAFHEFGCDLLAYALMPNHVHLVIRDQQGQLSRCMQILNARYTRYFNRRYQRIGHLYQGRFYARLVDRNEYLLQVTRYVHLNPVRARLAARPADYTWSSYRAYVGFPQGHVGCPADPQMVWSLMGGGNSRQPAACYREFVEAMTPEELPSWERRLRHLKLIGSARFASEVSDTFPALRSV